MEMELSERIDEYIANLGEQWNVDDITDGLQNISVISAEDQDKIKTASDDEKFEILITALIGKGNHTVSLIQKLTETYDSAQRKKQIVPNRILNSAEVSEDWPLKVFLFRISQKIGPDEFMALKDIIGGESGFKAQALEKIETAMQLFRHMLETRKISPYNLIFLQSILWILGRRDLMEEFITFSAENIKRPIHFYIPNDTPENGYRYIRYKIGGHIGNLKRKQLEELRKNVSLTLCVPERYVILDGIEPSNSILLTFMVPEKSIETFISFAEHHKDYVEEFGLVVEIIQDNLVFKEKSAEDIPQSQEENKMQEYLKEMICKEQKLKEALESQAENLLKLEKVESGPDVIGSVISQNLEERTQEVNMYKKMFHKALDAIDRLNISEDLVKNGQNEKHIPSLTIQSCLTLYMTLLAKAKEKKMDMEVLSNLLDVTSTLSALREKYKLVLTLQQMKDIIVSLERSADILQIENVMLKANTLVTGMSSNILHDFLNKNEQARLLSRVQLSFSLPKKEMVPGIHTDTQLLLDPILLQMLHAMSKELKPDECEKLRQSLKLNTIEEEMLSKGNTSLIEIAFKREIQSRRTPETIGNVLSSILCNIQRKDLIEKYLRIPS